MTLALVKETPDGSSGPKTPTVDPEETLIWKSLEDFGLDELGGKLETVYEALESFIEAVDLTNRRRVSVRYERARGRRRGERSSSDYIELLAESAAWGALLCKLGQLPRSVGRACNWLDQNAKTATRDLEKNAKGRVEGPLVARTARRWRRRATHRLAQPW
jgi:hypothetical protein